ncbi:MAG: PaeR7I family type II restriction endonuclease [Bifidobacteriaceae bacterium]|jgi:hypothetical protein|nr:PaeR7I family type II restriction endonuclease [Bifidobacteriaceae bacterium]
MLVEDCPPSRKPGQRVVSPHFPALPEFEAASYLERYNILCRKLMQERPHTAAGLVTSPREAGSTGVYNDVSEETQRAGLLAPLRGGHRRGGQLTGNRPGARKHGAETRAAGSW